MASSIPTLDPAIAAIALMDPSERAERAKFEQHHSPITMGGLPVGNPYAFRQFPQMMYMARQVPPGLPGAGKYLTAIPAPEYYGFRDADEWNRACQAAERFTASCQRTVGDQREYERARDEGWRDTPQEAAERAESFQKDISDAAAHRHYEDRNLGEKARAEVERFEADNFGHQPEVPRAAERKRRSGK